MGYANPAANERGLPSAMKSRPKIIRTPGGIDEGTRPYYGDDYGQEDVASNN